MNTSAVFAPGEKTHKDENFPVASYIIAKKYRRPVLAFYRFARASDDIADHPELSEQEKIAQLDQFEATLLGASDEVADALPLREELRRNNLSPRHALDLLVAFRQDARKARYKDWDELMGYCMVSAAPVGRFVLDVHGENQAIWPASDALCSALQIINHLQDCKADYQRLNRVYIPEETLARHGTTEAALEEESASPALRGVITELAAKTALLLVPVSLSPQVNDWRLRLEVLVIEKLAHKLLALLMTRDPLSQRVHLGKPQFIFILMQAVLASTFGRAFNHNG